MTSADVMILESRLKALTRMRLGLRILRGQHNTSFDNPVMFTFGSNSFIVDREDLEAFADLEDMEENIGANRFMNEYMYPFLRNFAK